VEITITSGTFLGVDWHAWAAVAATIAALFAGAAAYFTFRLWQTARDELRAVLDVSKQNLEGHTAEIGELRRQRDLLRKQVEIAAETMRVQLRPSVVVRVTTGRPSHGAEPMTWNSGIYFVQLENIGVGPAFNAKAEIWITQNPDGAALPIPNEARLVGRGTPHFSIEPENIGPGAIVTARATKNHEPGRIPHPFAILWKVTHEDGFGDPRSEYGAERFS